MALCKDVSSTSPLTPSAITTVLCLVAYLLFSLQQVVIADWLGSGVSLGATAIRVLVGASSVWLWRRQGIPPVLRLPFLAVLACMAALAASVLMSAHPVIAIKFAIKYGTSLLLLWILLNLALAFPAFPLAATKAALLALWGNLLLSIGVRFDSAVLKNLSLAFHPEASFKYLPRVSGIYEHPAIFCAISVMLALLVTQLYLLNRLTKPAWLWAVTGACLTLLLTESRNALVPLVAFAGGMALLRRKEFLAYGVWRILGGIALLAGFLAFMLWKRHAELTSAIHESPLTAFSLGRTYIWAGAFEAWRSHPWTGLGAGVFQFLTPDYTGGRFDRGELHAHNLMLAILSETGLAGFSAYALLLYSIWMPLLKRGIGAAGRHWILLWLLTLPCFGLFDFYLPFYGFTIHLALVIANQYALAYPCPEKRMTGRTSP
ncbi:O-antigen ligase family protein [Methylomonas fluvii]|uniref:O-antigen ligase family protein n=1 Tax=Methylomonas fluvii TaxID=1854564 RepID=A0ABR9DHQ9_9GAMM|nr:O-antigen ligase family protein [Methylomonas fluvii]MBD9362455.1 O-antigen ligase family protein [Methylomonas fluvii]